MGLSVADGGEQRAGGWRVQAQKTTCSGGSQVNQGRLWAAARLGRRTAQGFHRRTGAISRLQLQLQTPMGYVRRARGP